MLARLSAPRATIISIDLPGGKFGGGQSRIRSLLYHAFGKLFQSMHVIRGDSHSEEVAAKVRDITQSLDVLFIDGDHTYEGVKHDFLSYSPLVRTGGIVALHDIAGFRAGMGMAGRSILRWKICRLAFQRSREVLGVPGNHDVPLYNVFTRFFAPLARAMSRNLIVEAESTSGEPWKKTIFD